MTKRIYISDLHLQQVDSPAFSRFTECMTVEATWADDIIILGDLVEMWVGDDDDSELATELRRVLSSASQHCQLSLLHGNRDFLLGQKFAESCGVELLQDISLTGDAVMLCHGDSLCTDDHEYQALRDMLRSTAWQEEILAKSLSERKALGQAMRAQSQATNANKASQIMDVNAQATQQLINDHNSQMLIHGHTHRPGIHQLTDSRCKARIVLGAWERCGWLCRQENSAFQLECFSLARRYESGNTHPGH